MSTTSILAKEDRALHAQIPAIILLGGALNGFVVRIIESWHLSGAGNIFFGISPFELIAIAVAALLYFEAPSKPEFKPGIAEALCLAAILIPSSTFSWAATFLYAIFHATRSQHDLKKPLLLFATLSLCSIWTSLIMKWVAIPVTNFEASLVWQTISLFRHDLTLNGNIIGIENGHRIVLLIACSTIYGLPKAALGFIAISIYLNNSNQKSLLIGLATTLLIYAAANLIRLIAMTWSEPAFQIAHGPIGSNIFDATTTAIIFAIAFLAAERPE